MNMNKKKPLEGLKVIDLTTASHHVRFMLSIRRSRLLTATMVSV